MPMHFLGLAGLPRRIPDYADGFLGWNNIITLGSILTAISVVQFLYVVSNTIFVNKKYYLAPVKYSKFNNLRKPNLKRYLHYRDFMQNYLY